jgi:hypothetical protein
VSAERPDGLARLQWAALIIGLLGLAASALGAIIDFPGFLRSYLAAVLAWLAFPLGALGMLVVWHLLGGRWGLVLGEVFEAMARTLPLLAALFLPLLFALEALYPWARQPFVEAHPMVAEKLPYLNAPFFIARALLYLAIWTALAFALTTPRTPPRSRERSLRLGSAGAILLAFTVSCAAVDWMLSLDPTVHSSVFGMLVGSGYVLAAFAFALIVGLLLARSGAHQHLLREQGLVGLGSIFLALVLLWAYFAFIQYLIVWSGDLPDEAGWYLTRSGGAWSVVDWLVGAGQFGLPAVVLLSSRARRNPTLLLSLAALLVLTHFLHSASLTLPPFHEEEVPAAWLAAATMAAVGGLWLLAFGWLLAPRARRFGQTVEEMARG